MDKVSLHKIIEVDAHDGVATIKGFGADNAAVEIEMTLEAITTLMPNLEASEAELIGEQQGQRIGPVYFYGGADLKSVRDQGYMVLVLQCLAARPDRPGRKIGFQISVGDLAELGKFCSKNAQSHRPSGRRPS